MRVAIDGRTLQSRPLGGVGRTVRGVLRALPDAAAAQGLDLAGIDLLTDRRLPPPEPPDVPSGVETHALRAPVPGRGVAWLQSGAPRWLASTGRTRDVGLFHCPFYGLPYRHPVPMVVSMYDLSFLSHGHWFPPVTRLAFRAQARHAARAGRVVITGSATVAALVAQDLGVAPDRIVIAPPAVDRVFFDAYKAPEARRSAGPWRGGYVVAMGGAPRRNLTVAVRAWQAARESGAEVELVVVGPLTAAERRLVDGTPEVHAPGAPPDPDLARLLADAVAFVYPTLYEGFGLPAAEAAAAGAPVVSAPVGALPDLLGGAAEWCNPAPSGPSVEAVAAAILRLVHDPERAGRIGTAAHERMLAAPGHDSAARKWAVAYRRALDA